MILRCLIIVVLTTNQVFTQSDDDITAEWLKKRAKNVIKQDTEDDFSLDPSTGPQTFRKDDTNEENNDNFNLDPNLDILRKDDTNEENNDNFNLDPNLDILRLNSPPSVRPNPPILNRKEVVNNETNLNSSSSEEPQKCFTKDNQPGACVLYFQCDPDYRTIVDDGNSLIDLRFQERSCRHNLEVCCLLSEVITATDNILPEPLYLSKLVKFDADAETCGWSNPALHIFQTTSKENDDNRIYANYGDFPWIIALIKKRNTTDEWSRNDYLGGGTLIHPAVVLTAAHKVEQFAASEIKCRAGEWNTQTTFELFQHQERMVKKKIIHPEYFRVSLYNDIAVLFLESEFKMTNSPNIGLACVGTSLPPPGTKCFSMGWGKEFNEKNKYAVILKKVRLPLVGADDCEVLLRKTHLGSYFKLHKSLTCAGGESGVDTCRGDGGSPLVCPVQTMGESTRYAVVGMVAYGIGCGRTDRPSVYVNVPYLKPWLDSTVTAEGYTTHQYRNKEKNIDLNYYYKM